MPRKKKPEDVTDAELTILSVLWDRGRATIREIADDVYPGGSTSEYATVGKLLERLENKGCVARRRGPGRHVFEATIDRQSLVDRELTRTADRLCGGSVAPLLTHLVHHVDLSAAQRRALADLVEGLDPAEEDGS